MSPHRDNPKMRILCVNGNDRLNYVIILDDEYHMCKFRKFFNQQHNFFLDLCRRMAKHDASNMVCLSWALAACVDWRFDLSLCNGI